MPMRNVFWQRFSRGLVTAALAFGCVGVQADNDVIAPGGFPGLLPGYLAPPSLPNSLALVPPMPSADSSALMLDEEISRRSFLLRDTARWMLAVSDADLNFPHAAGTVARLYTQKDFRADLEAAEGELADVRRQGLKPDRDCAAEAAALALQPTLAQ